MWPELVPQQPPTRLSQPASRKRPEDALEDVRPLGVAAVLVGQAGVGDAGDPRAADLGEGADVVGHQVGAGGAVEAHIEKVGVEQGDGERLGVLAAEHGAGGLDGRRDGDRELPPGLGEGLLDADQAGLDVAGVLRGLQQQVVGAAGHQAERLDAEVLDQPLEGDAAGHRDRLGGRPHGAADEAGFFRRRVARAGAAGDGGGQAVELEGVIGEAVLAQHQRGAAEGVGLHDVAAGGEVPLVDAVHHVGAGDAEVLVAPLELGAAEVVGGQGDSLERRAGGAVEHEDAGVEGRQQEGGALVHVGGTRGKRYVEDRIAHSLSSWAIQKSPTRRHHETGFPLRTLNCHREGGDRILAPLEREGTLGVRPRLPSPAKPDRS